MAEPVRTCVACRKSRDRSRLVRLVHVVDTGDVWIDPGPGSRVRRPAGRGAYVCAEAGCVTRAIGTGALRRALRLDGPLPAGVAIGLERRADRLNGEVGDGETEGA